MHGCGAPIFDMTSELEKTPVTTPDSQTNILVSVQEAEAEEAKGSWKNVGQALARSITPDNDNRHLDNDNDHSINRDKVIYCA